MNEPASSAPAGGSSLARVGVVSAWFDPEDPQAWSGVPRGVVEELRRLGVYAGSRSATPWLPVSRIVHRWMTLTKRSKGWTRRGEMKALTQLSDAAKLIATPRDIDGWVHFVGANGPVTGTRYVTVFEMSPAQLVEAASTWRESFGYPHATREQMGWVARRQVALYQKAYACCMASRWAADSLVRDHGIPASKVHVVGYGRNAEAPPARDRDWSTPRFLFVGRDWRRKNGDAVLRAFRRLRAELPAACLDLVGDHPEVSVEGVTGYGSVRVSDPQGRSTIESLFARATCFVLPSKIEPFGIVYVEAAAAGVASIAGSVGGTADSVGDGGMLVDPDDDDAIYRAMRTMSDPDTARTLGAAAHRRSSLFTWRMVGQRVLRALDLGGAPGVTLAEFVTV